MTQETLKLVRQPSHGGRIPSIQKIWTLSQITIGRLIIVVAALYTHKMTISIHIREHVCFQGLENPILT